MMLDVETNFDYYGRRRWLQANWFHSVVIAAVYLVLVLLGRSVMKSRSGFSLKSVLFIWNLLLAVFSAVGTSRCLPELVQMFTVGGLRSAICSESSQLKGPYGYWVWLFCMSKVVELGDSVLLVLRKRPLVFIHYYHHASVLVFTWFTNSQALSCGRWYLVMNYFIHTIMYAYYAVRTFSVHVPRWIPMCITGLQVTQMFIGLLVTVYAFIQVNIGNECETTLTNAVLGIALYASYFVLFYRLFVKSYFAKKHISSDSEKKQVDSVNGNLSNGTVNKSNGKTCTNGQKSVVSEATSDGEMRSNLDCSEFRSLVTGGHFGGHLKAN
ncbi:putative fatty acid elongation protein 3 [Halotydeus destructor]|nr:putative fatty acid elongation protein 3 [Halotydeus destructor]